MKVARKEKVGYEVVCEAVFRPLAQLLVVPLAALRVPPPAVVLANAASAIAAALLIARGQLVGGALLLQAKTLLDNADGQLARTTGRTTAFGRYLDSLCDLATNAAVFAAVGYLTGHPWVALASYVALTIVLSVNFNLDRLARGLDPQPSGGGLLERAYAAVYAPQDRLAERLFPSPRGLGLVANFGLSTQLAALGVCLVLGHPVAYLFVPFACLLAVAPLAGTARPREAL